MQSQAPVRFGVIGTNHNHIYGMADQLIEAGAVLEMFYEAEPELAAEFARRFPRARQAREAAEVLESDRLALIASAIVPDQRAPLGVEAMRHGKDYLSDKPAFTTLDQLAEARRVQRETGQIYSVSYSERLQNAATVRAAELVLEHGAIGRPLQTIGMGPHRLNAKTRPAWFFKHRHYGGIINDIGSHQVDQFLYFTRSTSAEVVCAQVANLAHPEYPELEDFGDLMLQGDGGRGYIRVDWFSPDGVPGWGDARLFVIGTEGSYRSAQERRHRWPPGGSHLFLADGKGTRYIDCQDVRLPFGYQLLDDVRNRTETAMSQAHAFLASELALTAQRVARVDCPD